MERESRGTHQPIQCRLTTDLQEELENFIEKTRDLSAGLQYLMLQDNGEEGIWQYEWDMAAMVEDNADLITCVRAAVVNDPEPKVTFHTPPAINNRDDAAAAGTLRLSSFIFNNSEH